VTQPLNRNCWLPQLGEIDHEAGEFWVENPFVMQHRGMNLSAFERNRLYLNRRGIDFIDASFAEAVNLDSDSRSVVAADFDRDGATDLLVGSAGGGPLRLFLNRFQHRGRSLLLNLVGVQSNRAGIGARVVVECGSNKIVRDVFPANAFMGQGPAELLIGVGPAETIDSLSVRWPTGETQTFSDLPVDATITITEGQPRARIRSN